MHQVRAVTPVCTDRREANPIKCRLCYDLPWRRPESGCERCGGEYKEAEVTSAIEYADRNVGGTRWPATY